MPSSSTSSVSSPPRLLPLWEGATWEHPGAHSCLAPPLHRRRNNGHLLSWLRPVPPTSFLQILALTLYKMVGNWSPAVCPQSPRTPTCSCKAFIGRDDWNTCQLLEIEK